MPRFGHITLADDEMLARYRCFHYAKIRTEEKDLVAAEMKKIQCPSCQQKKDSTTED